MTNPVGYCKANQAYAYYTGHFRLQNPRCLISLSVPILKFQITYVNKEKTFGELQVYFDTEVWNVERDGLIYLDPGWLRDLQNLLIGLGFSEEAAQSVEYSEQGMQGDDFVSLDIKEQFILECDPIRLFTINCPIGYMFKLPEAELDAF